MKDLEKILDQLVGHNVEFIVVGGVAAVAHGSPRATFDVGVVYRRTNDNLERLVIAFQFLHPYPRGKGVPPGLPFIWDVKTLQRGLSFTLSTDIGNVDFLGEVTGGGQYDELLQRSEEVEALGLRCYCVDLDTLIVLKRAAGRPKDFEAIAELEAILEERQESE